MFDKPAKTTDELAQLIHDRGFFADEAGNVESALRRINYYRLSAYMKSFELTDSVQGSPSQSV
jgi:abortive infection bacteriophage resistance protein